MFLKSHGPIKVYVSDKQVTLAKYMLLSFMYQIMHI